MLPNFEVGELQSQLADANHKLMLKLRDSLHIVLQDLQVNS